MFKSLLVWNMRLSYLFGSSYHTTLPCSFFSRSNVLLLSLLFLLFVILAPALFIMLVPVVCYACSRCYYADCCCFLFSMGCFFLRLSRLGQTAKIFIVGWRKERRMIVCVCMYTWAVEKRNNERNRTRTPWNMKKACYKHFLALVCLFFFFFFVADDIFFYNATLPICIRNEAYRTATGWNDIPSNTAEREAKTSKRVAVVVWVKYLTG